MLIEFRFENFRSVAEEQVLSLEAAASDGDERLREASGHIEPLLPVAAIYGANASGKTTVLSGFAYMRDAVLSSLRHWEPEGGTEREPFAWHGMPDRPSLFEVTALIQGTRYRYGFRLDDQHILEEWLHAWPSGKRQLWFEREGQDIKLGKPLANEKTRLLGSLTRPNALFLSMAAQHGLERLAPLYQWFSTSFVFNARWAAGNAMVRHYTTTWLAERMAAEQQMPAAFGQGASLRNSFLDVLRAADLGISDLRVEEITDTWQVHDGQNFEQQRYRVFLRHGDAEGQAWLPLEKESLGTITLFDYARQIIEALANGRVLLIDELERSLHPLLALWIVSRFNSKATNPNNAQLIFSTHDTNLLGHTLGAPALRRDQVWLTEKNAQGATELYPLTNFKPRKDENLERGYLQGRYGAIPVLGRLDISGD